MNFLKEYRVDPTIRAYNCEGKMMMALPKMMMAAPKLLFNASSLS